MKTFKAYIAEQFAGEFGMQDTSVPPEAAKFLDPTGILSWPDIPIAINTYNQHPTPMNALFIILAFIAVIPAAGKFTKPLKMAARAGKTAEVEKLISPAVQEILNHPDILAKAKIDKEFLSKIGSFVSKMANKTTKTIKDFYNPNEFYRVIIGDNAFNDIVQSGKVRTIGGKGYIGAGYNPTVKGLTSRIQTRPTAFPSFSKGRVDISYTNNNPNHYIISSSHPSIIPSTRGRHGKGSTHFPTNQGIPGELDARYIDVYKHLGNGQYKLVYSKGAPVQ